MAEFTIREVEGMRQVRIEIANETVRARRGALSTLRGDIKLTPRLPAVGDLFRSIFTSEARIRPFYTGQGTIMLQPSLSGYHLLDIQPDEAWVLEPGVYWASEGGVALGMRREPFWSSLWSGDGMLVWKTLLRNTGRVAINAPGPVEVVDVDGELRVQGRLVLGRTAGLKFSSRPAARFPRGLIAGQKRLRVYTGKGKALVCWTPYWNEHLYRRMTGESIEGSLME